MVHPYSSHFGGHPALSCCRQGSSSAACSGWGWLSFPPSPKASRCSNPSSKKMSPSLSKRYTGPPASWCVPPQADLCGTSLVSARQPRGSVRTRAIFISPPASSTTGLGRCRTTPSIRKAPARGRQGKTRADPRVASSGSLKRGRIPPTRPWPYGSTAGPAAPP